jgi:hypothetical protein
MSCYSASINGLTDGIILNSEEEFKLRTKDALNNEREDYEMTKSMDKFCNVDFIILNKRNILSVLIEHKRKNIDGSSDKYPTFYIGTTKLAMIECFYSTPLILVFECNDDVYWVVNDAEFLKRPSKFIRGSKCIEIRKDECGVGFKKLIKTLKDTLNFN